MSEPKQKEIDIPSGRLMAGGEEYYIQYSLSTTRYVEYLKRVPRLTFHTTFAGMYDTLSKIYMLTSSGNDMIYAIGQSRELSWNQLESIKRFDENEVLEVIDLCGLFINKAGENISKFDPAIHEQKCKILHEEGYDHASFFTLAFGLIDNLNPAYHRIRSVSNPNALNDIALNQDSQPTNHTS